MTPANVGAMGRTSRGVLAVLVAVVIVAALGGCGGKAAKEATNPPASPAASGAAAEFAATLRDRVKADAMMAPSDEACRRSPTPTTATARSAPPATTQASTTWRRRCVTRVSTCRRPSSRCACRSPRNPSSPSAARRSRPSRLQFTIGTPDEGVSGPLVAARVEDSPGCTASDYDGLPVQGALVLVDRGTCQFSAEAGRGRRARCGGADRRQQRGRRRDGRHARREDRTRRSRSSASPRLRASGCAARRARPRSSSRPGSASRTPAMSSPRRRPAPPPTW